MTTVTLDILFVRHGISCANVVQDIYGHPDTPEHRLKPGDPDSRLYQDPELSTRGIQRSRELQLYLNHAIQNIFGGRPFGVNSSCMIRTQQTAYYMLLEPLVGLQFNIIPYVGEGPNQLDNTPYEKAVQRGILGDAIVSRIENDDRGDYATLLDVRTRSNAEEFKKWLCQIAKNGTIGKYFKSTDDNKFHRRALIFTHRGFMHQLFGTTVGNNQIISARFTINNLQECTIEVSHSIISDDFTPITADMKKDAAGCDLSKARPPGAAAANTTSRELNELGLGGLNPEQLRAIQGKFTEEIGRLQRMIELINAHLRTTKGGKRKNRRTRRKLRR